MKKLISCLILLALLPVAFMGGCGSSSAPTSSNPAATSTSTVAFTATKTNTVTNTATQTGTLTLTSTFTNTATNTATATVTNTVTSTPSGAVNLRTAANYVVLAGSAITNTGTTNVCGGLLGISPATDTSVTGSQITCAGSNVSVDDTGTAAQAEADLGTAYADASSRPNPTIITAGELGSITLTPGVYYSATSAGVTTGNLTLSGAGVYIFEIGTTLINATSSQVILSNGATAANVFWAVGTSATLGSSSSFVGNILAQQAITFDTSSVLEGRALAENSFLTFSSTNTISFP